MAIGRRQARGARLLFAVSLGVGLPLLALCALTLPGPPTAETIVFAIGTLVATAGGFAARRSARGVQAAALGAAIAFATIGYRIFAASGGVTVQATSEPDGSSGRIVDRLLPERDVAIGGSWLLLALGLMPEDQPGLLDALRNGYGRMRRDEGPVPSPVLGTFVFGQGPTSHAVVRVSSPARERPAEAVMVFLHGSMGNVTLLCWQVAQAAIPAGVDVVCPSAGTDARWAGPDGIQTVESTIREARRAGAQRVYLAGLSAGAIGASRIAASLEVDGVLLISGASSQPRPAPKPTLVLAGGLDQMTPPPPARAYASAVGGQAEYREHPEAGHWMVLSHHEWTRAHIERWLSERERQAELSSVAPPR